MSNQKITFLNLPAADGRTTDCEVGVLGVPQGIPYGPEQLFSDAIKSPEAIRNYSQRFSGHLDKFDFDTDRNVLDSIRVYDFGDVEWNLDIQFNSERATESIKNLVDASIVPVVFGGDDSVTALVANSYKDFGKINVLQIDAHIDYRDEVNGNSRGYSSPMRRIGEMPWVNKVVQVGGRGSGSAYKEDYLDAKHNGHEIITARSVLREGISSVTKHIDNSAPWLVVIDVDGFDPTIAPGTSAPLPGGLDYYHAVELIEDISNKSSLCGISFVEHFPSLDIRGMTSLLITRIVMTFVNNIKTSTK